MIDTKIHHYALIPAKERSSRCPDKNWKPFVAGYNLVEYLLAKIPDGFFDEVILSTDKSDVYPQGKVVVHRRDKCLATKESPVNDLISVIISSYKLSGSGYIWLLNPTSPLRKKEDFFNIKRIVETKGVPGVISASEINPFIWKDASPTFDTAYPRKNTQDFTTKYFVENGQFIVFRISDFLVTRTWHKIGTVLYPQKSVRCLVDIDTVEDFQEAQQIGGAINEK